MLCFSTSACTQLHQDGLLNPPPVKVGCTTKQLLLQAIPQQAMQLQEHISICASAPAIRSLHQHFVADMWLVVSSKQLPANASIILLS